MRFQITGYQQLLLFFVIIYAAAATIYIFITAQRPIESPSHTIGDYDVFETNKIEDKVTDGWQESACPTRPPAPAFPVTLPRFAPSPITKNIFFLETKCSTSINAKMACAVESAALHHPDHHIHLAFTAAKVSATDTIMQVLAQISNVHITSLDIDTLAANSGKLGTWIKSLQWAKGTEWAGINLSDAVRLVAVCQVGGTYLDLDLITIAPFPTTDAWVGREKWEQLSNGAFRLPKNHWLCEQATRELTENYRGDVWGHNGPGVFQRAIKNACNLETIQNTNHCRDLVMLEPPAFYQIRWQKWEELFKAGGSANWEWPQSAVGLHLWNKFSYNAPLYPGDSSVIDQVAEQHCPRVYNAIQTVRRINLLLSSPGWLGVYQ